MPKNMDDHAQVDFLTHEASKQAVTKVFFHAASLPQQNLAVPGMLPNLRSLELSGNLLTAEFLSTLSTVRLSNSCRRFAISEHLSGGSGIEGADEATEFVKFLQLNNQIDDLDLIINSLDAAQIIAAHLEGLTTLYHLKLMWPSILNHEMAQQTSVWAALSSIEFTEGIELTIAAMDGHLVEIIEELAQKMTKGNRQLGITIRGIADTIPAEDTETFSSFLRAAIGSKSNLLIFSLETDCRKKNLNQVTLALESALPNLSPRLNKIRLYTTLWETLATDEKTAFKTRVIRALDKNVDVLALKWFDLKLNMKADRISSFFSENTDRQFRSFAAKKSIQRICAMPPTVRGFPLATLPKALEKIQGNPHIDTKQFSAAILYHCLQNSKDLQEKAATYLVQTKKNSNEN